MNEYGYVQSRNGLIHEMRDTETAQCGVVLTDGRRVKRGKMGMCSHCKRAGEIRRELLARLGGEVAKMRMLKELSEIVNRNDSDEVFSGDRPPWMR